MLAFDIGAYDGCSIPRLRKMGCDKIVAVEPHDSSFLLLERDYDGDDDVEFVKLAVHDKSDEELDFFMSNKKFLSTLDKSWIDAHRHVSANVVSIKKVKTITLDGLISLYGVPNYIKIDVEGHELSAIKGLTKKIDLLSFEYISKLSEKNIDCVKECERIGYNEFYVSYFEHLPTILDSEPHIPSFGMADITKIKTYFYEKHTPSSLYDFFNDIKNYKVWGNIWCVEDVSKFNNINSSEPWPKAY